MQALRGLLITVAWSVFLLLIVAVAGATSWKLPDLAQHPDGVLLIDRNFGALDETAALTTAAAGHVHDDFALRPRAITSLYAAATSALLARYEVVVAAVGLVVFLPLSAWLLRRGMGNAGAWGRREWP